MGKKSEIKAPRGLFARATAGCRGRRRRRPTENPVKKKPQNRGPPTVALPSHTPRAVWHPHLPSSNHSHTLAMQALIAMQPASPAPPPKLILQARKPPPPISGRLGSGHAARVSHPGDAVGGGAPGDSPAIVAAAAAAAAPDRSYRRNVFAMQPSAVSQPRYPKTPWHQPSAAITPVTASAAAIATAAATAAAAAAAAAATTAAAAATVAAPTFALQPKTQLAQPLSQSWLARAQWLSSQQGLGEVFDCASDGGHGGR